MRQGEHYPYEIIKHNPLTHEGGESVKVVMGLSAAISAVNFFDGQLTKEERDAGWSHFHKRTTKRPPPKARPRHNYKYIRKR